MVYWTILKMKVLFFLCFCEVAICVGQIWNWIGFEIASFWFIHVPVEMLLSNDLIDNITDAHTVNNTH